MKERLRYTGDERNINQEQIVEEFIDVKQLYHNAKVASVLCVCGPVQNKLKPEINID